mmetsp:Transcript_19513/g.45360  ORF Transcript_19513/g.45360 Transcript_19513/m.45360 type:complete len:219 (+) Transcript_19513:1537-2193(+)
MWPKLDLELVLTRGLVRTFLLCAITVALNAPTSIGSPNAVPVPCNSWTRMSSGVMLASFMDCLTHSCCDGPCGAVKLALLPSWLQDVPATTAKLNGSSLVQLFKQAPMTPSARMKPSADWSKVKQRPWWLNIPAPDSPTVKPGVVWEVVPNASPCCIRCPAARSHIPCSTARIVLCTHATAVSEDEQAVSTKNVGPVMLNIYCKRFDKAPGPALTTER